MISIRNRTTAYLVIALLRHLGYDVEADGIRRLEVLPKSIRVTLVAKDFDGAAFVGGDRGDETASTIIEHPMDWPN